MKLKKWTLLLLLAAVLTTLTACGGGASNSDKKTIKIGYLPITHAAPLYIEDDLSGGEFEHFNLELVRFSTWTDLVDALNTGNIDGASMLIELAIRAKEQGIDLKAVALGHKDGNVVVSALDVDSPQDLVGKNFAIPHKFSTHNILYYLMMKQAGLNYDDVNVVELGPAEMPVALSEGRISGYVVAEPFGARSVVIDKGKALYQSEDLWPESIDCGLVLRGELIEDHRDAVQEFVNAYVEAGRVAEHKDQEAKDILKKYMNVDDEVLELSLQWIKYDELRLDEEAYNTLIGYVVEMGLSEQPPTFEDFVDNSFIDKAMGL